jgi:hypothetical protein
MPVITTIAVFPNAPDKRVWRDQCGIFQAGKAVGRSFARDWSFLEAVTWIATRSHEMVNGVAPRHIEVAPIARQLDLKEPLGVEFMVASMVADTIAWAFCQCERKVACRVSVKEWNELTPQEQAAAASDPLDKKRLFYIRALQRNCTCFETAAQALFAAAATGKLSATAGLQHERICRLEWLQADYGLTDGLRFGDRRQELVRFRRAAILQTWPVLREEAMSLKGRGRPSANLQPIRDAFQRRRDQRIPLERSQIREWATCIELAASNGYTDLPNPDTCRRHLGSLFEAHSANKSG